MKKYFIYFLLISFFVTPALFLNLFVPTVSASAPSTISELVELLITIGVISPDKAVSARAAVVSLSQVHVSTSTVPVTSSGPLPYIQVLSPNGSESWEIQVNVPYTIKWGSTMAVPVSLALVSTKAIVCNLGSTIINSVVGDNSYNFILKNTKCLNSLTGSSTPLVSGTYKARVTYTSSASSTVKDDSDGSFKIIPEPIPSIKVTYPNGGERLMTSNYYDLKYTVTNTSERGIKFSFYNDLGNLIYSTTDFGSKGIYRMRIPSALSDGAYKLKIEMTTTNGVKIEDLSDNLFWVSHS